MGTTFSLPSRRLFSPFQDNLPQYGTDAKLAKLLGLSSDRVLSHWRIWSVGRVNRGARIQDESTCSTSKACAFRSG